jgi:benzodiazapine receptor
MKQEVAIELSKSLNRSVAQQVVGLAFFLTICIGAMVAGAIATTPNVTTWYKELAYPPWTPPAWLFGPVWAMLYIMMAVSAWLVWNRGGLSKTRRALRLLSIQLILNVCWSWLFFGMKTPGIALIEILILVIAVAITMVRFWEICRPAGLLFVPYITWVMFASSLNAGFWWLN